MKRLCALLMLSLIVCISGIATADIPVLLGNWTGSYAEYKAGQGFTDKEGGFFFLNITEQKDRIFAGYSTYTKSDGTLVSRNMAGAISADGTEISFVEENTGDSHGNIIGPNEFEVIFMTDTKPVTVAVDRFIRIS